MTDMRQVDIERLKVLLTEYAQACVDAASHMANPLLRPGPTFPRLLEMSDKNSELMKFLEQAPRVPPGEHP